MPKNITKKIKRKSTFIASGTFRYDSTCNILFSRADFKSGNVQHFITKKREKIERFKTKHFFVQ